MFFGKKKTAPKSKWEVCKVVCNGQEEIFDGPDMLEASWDRWTELFDRGAKLYTFGYEFVRP